MLLHGGKDTDNLSSLRYAKYIKMASTTLSLKPKKLPPTNIAAFFLFFSCLLSSTKMELSMRRQFRCKELG